MKKHKIALSDDELRLIADALECQKLTIMDDMPKPNNEAEWIQYTNDLESLKNEYNPLMNRIRKTIRKEA